MQRIRATLPTPGEACGLEWPEGDLTAGHHRRRLSAVKAHRRAQRRVRLAVGSVWIESGKVFCTEVGLPLHPGDVKDRLYELCAEAGLPPVRLHDLRHGAAALMLAAGVSTCECPRTTRRMTQMPPSTSVESSDDFRAGDDQGANG